MLPQLFRGSMLGLTPGVTDGETTPDMLPQGRKHGTTFQGLSNHATSLPRPACHSGDSRR